MSLYWSGLSVRHPGGIVRVSLFFSLPLTLAAAVLPTSHAIACESDAILRLALQPGELRTADWPAVALHADGCVRVHRPAWYRDPGDYELVLDASERATLLAARDAAARIDVSALSQRLASSEREIGARAAAGEPVVLHAAEGADNSRFDLGTARSFAWHGLEQDADAHPQLTDLATLRAAQRALIALMYDARALPARESAP